MKLKIFIVSAFVLWTGVILTLFFIVQKPVVLTVLNGFISPAFTIGFWLIFILAGTSIGYSFRSFSPEMDSTPRLYLFTGTGLGVLGLTGFGLAVIGYARPVVFATLLGLILIIGFWNHSLLSIKNDLKELLAEFRDTSELSPKWIKWFAIAAAGLSFILALAPPIESFDALLYHLPVPTWWLRDGGLRSVNFFPYWYPALGEGMFAWPLAFHNDIIPQLIHFTFGLLFIVLVWDWTKILWGAEASWWGIAIFLSMPSLTWLAAWAYTDLALIFFILAALYTLWKWKNTNQTRWLITCAIMTGLAMSIKYTSMILPVVIAGLMIWWGYAKPRKLLSDILLIATISLIIASPWYLRNWILMGNPIYPFLFGGRYWDAFRASWQTAVGSGIGYDAASLLTLPFTITLGYRDATYFDGRFGPLYLILFPVVVWVLWKSKNYQNEQKDALVITSIFALISILLWTYGVIQTSTLWQARLLWPGLIPLALPMTAGILELKKLDTPKFHPSFIFSTIVEITIFVFLLDFALLVWHRNPLAFALGLETRESYASHQQPEYTAAVNMVNKTPSDSYIYLVYEPRSYGMDRCTQPDPINDNLPHDFYLYRTNDELISAWQKIGYTHILLANKAIYTYESEKKEQIIPGFYARLENLKKLLIEVSRTEDGSYILYTLSSK